MQKTKRSQIIFQGEVYNMKKQKFFLIPGVLLAGILLILAAIFFISENTQHAQKLKLEPAVENRSAASNEDSTEVKSVIRDINTEFVRVNISNDLQRSALPNLGVVVKDNGSFAILAKSASLDLSKSGLEVQNIETTINLPGVIFEPLIDVVQSSKAESSDHKSSIKSYHIVQFGGYVDDYLLDNVRSLGGEIVQYIPHNAFLIYADQETIERISEMDRVRWTGEYKPEYKISRETERFIADKREIETIYDIAVFSRANLEEVKNEITFGLNGRVLQENILQRNYFNIIRTSIPTVELARVSELKDVFTIEPYIRPSKEDERAAHIVAGNYTGTSTISPPGYNPSAQFGVNGNNVTVAVVDDGVGIPGDGGFYVTASNAVNGPLRGAPAGALGHGHLQASIIAGTTPFSNLDPLGYNYGSGVAPGSHIVNIPLLLSGYNASDSVMVNDTVTSTGPNGVRTNISNNSWGAGTNGNAYGTYEAMYDGFVMDASTGVSIDPLTIIFSAGNSGTLGLTRPKISKNTISVANAMNYRPEISGSANNIDNLSSSSSRGPSSDGRIKPNITAPGSAITGGRSGSDPLFGNIDTHHRWSSGTSHAAPQVAGAAALFTEFWKSQTGMVPSPAMIKASIINTGQEMTGVGTTASVPNGNEGWGRINLKYMFNTGASMKYVDQQDHLLNVGDNVVYNGSISNSEKPFRITLVWSDPPGAVNPALVNNLDLVVTVGGVEYKGNVFTSGISSSGGTADSINNVENVWLPAGIPVGTPVTVEVKAIALNGDGILGNGDATDQTFSLVAYNFNEGGAAAQVSVSGRVLTTSGRGIPNAYVYIEDSNGQRRAAVTNFLGYYIFDGVASEQDYTISVESKQYSFNSQTVTVSGELNNVNFIPVP